MRDLRDIWGVKGVWGVDLDGSVRGSRCRHLWGVEGVRGLWVWIWS